MQDLNDSKENCLNVVLQYIMFYCLLIKYYLSQTKAIGR